MSVHHTELFKVLIWSLQGPGEKRKGTNWLYKNFLGNSKQCIANFGVKWLLKCALVKLKSSKSTVLSIVCSKTYLEKNSFHWCQNSAMEIKMALPWSGSYSFVYFLMLCFASFEQSEFPHYTRFHTPQKQNTLPFKPCSNDRKKEACKFNRKCLQCLEYLNKVATLEKLVRWCFPVLLVMENIFLGRKEGEGKKRHREK